MARLALVFGIVSLICSLSITVAMDFEFISYKLAAIGYCINIVLGIACGIFIWAMERA